MIRETSAAPKQPRLTELSAPAIFPIKRCVQPRKLLPCLFSWRSLNNSCPHPFRRISLQVEAFKPPCHPSFSERRHFLSILPQVSPGCPTNVDKIKAPS